MSEGAVLRLFEGYGIEIEYMIVDVDTLDVRPICDELLFAVAGSFESEIERGDIAWSNELALHVLEFKTNGPSKTIADLGPKFQAQVGDANDRLRAFGAQLLPTGMHPWMDARRDFRLWPHEHNAVYQAFDRIFDCAGHGWVNVQSTHINLPFASDAEFAKLHAAIRLVMPLIPALAASTPAVDGDLTGVLDTRLRYYATNCARIPSVTGAVIPEAVFSIDEYRQHLLPRIYRDLAPFDKDGVLQHEWVNARGAIARFDRMALEIRIIDTQECPAADIGVAAAISAVVQAHVEEAWCSVRDQQAWDHRELGAILRLAIGAGDEAVLDHKAYLQCFGFPERGPARFGEIWQHLVETAVSAQQWSDGSKQALQTILRNGCLARRIVVAARDDTLHSIYSRLASCLSDGSSFVP